MDDLQLHIPEAGNDDGNQTTMKRPSFLHVSPSKSKLFKGTVVEFLYSLTV